jgi:hypothetical protein
MERAARMAVIRRGREEYYILASHRVQVELSVANVKEQGVEVRAFWHGQGGQFVRSGRSYGLPGVFYGLYRVAYRVDTDRKLYSHSSVVDDSRPGEPPDVPGRSSVAYTQKMGHLELGGAIFSLYRRADRMHTYANHLHGIAVPV